MKIKLIDSATCIAVLTSYFYCISTAYTNGYLAVFGLDNDLLDRNFHQVIYSGFISGYVGIFSLIAFLFLMMFFWAMFKVGLNEYLQENISNKRKYRKLKKTIGFPVKKKSKLGRKLWLRVLVLGLPMAFMFCLIFNLSYYEKKGIDDAKQWKVEIAKGNASVVTVDKYKNELAYLYCGSKNCAGYDMKEQKTIYFPQTILAIQNKNITIKAIETKDKTASLDPAVN
ncbi:hypothetical protein [Photobacterium kishitanii]|uniref:hypothetical protein n=1 Tax=Photobacterium kishitanii TaxID=318456 RepID=UPI0011B1DE90|nr:hypothetical protein [Photobacterium kishitanii]